jgi:hypothetical protein
MPQGNVRGSEGPLGGKGEAVNAEEYNLTAGNPERWKAFAEKHHEFLLRVPKLVDLANKTFNREWETREPLDRIVFTFGVMCWEDWEEILVLGANGYGFGCLKILRGMYERLVTISHLRRHPEEVDRFLDWHYVADYKVSRELATGFGKEQVPNERLDEKKKLRDSVIDTFMRTCTTKDCDRQIPMFSWSNVDFVSMARGDKGFGDIVSFCYYIPMTETHPSVRAMMARMAEGKDGGVTLGNRMEKALEWASNAVCTAHNLTVQNLDIQQQHFKELEQYDAELRSCLEDFKASWGEARQANP